MRHLPVLSSDGSRRSPSPAACDAELDDLDVQTPCDVPWDTMSGDSRVRFCGQCRQNVYNIEALARAEVVRLVAAREGRLCVRFHRRPDGTVVTADCWARLRAARRKGVLAFVALLAFVGVAQVFAIVVGLAGLKGVTRGPSPLISNRHPLPAPEPRLMGIMGRRSDARSVRTMGEVARPGPAQSPAAPHLTPPFILNRMGPK